MSKPNLSSRHQSWEQGELDSRGRRQGQAAPWSHEVGQAARPASCHVAGTQHPHRRSTAPAGRLLAAVDLSPACSPAPILRVTLGKTHSSPGLHFHNYWYHRGIFRAYSLGQLFLIGEGGVTIWAPGDTWQCPDTVWMATIGRQGCQRHLVGEASGAADHLTGSRTGPPQCYRVSVHGAKEEKPGGLRRVCEDQARAVQRWSPRGNAEKQSGLDVRWTGCAERFLTSLGLGCFITGTGQQCEHLFRER